MSRFLNFPKTRSEISLRCGMNTVGALTTAVDIIIVLQNFDLADEQTDEDTLPVKTLCVLAQPSKAKGI